MVSYHNANLNLSLLLACCRLWQLILCFLAYYGSHFHKNDGFEINQSYEPTFCQLKLTAK